MLIHQTTNSVGNYNYNAYIYDNCEWYYHFHNNYELLYVQSGELRASIDTHTEELCAGDFALILPNQIHSYQTPNNSKVWIGVFSEDFIYAFSAHINKKVGVSAKFQCDATLKNYVLYHLIDVNTRDTFLLKSCFYAICNQYLKNITLIDQQFDNEDLLCKMIDYVSNHFKSNITLKQMAADLGFEYHYLSRRFHSIFNMNFCQFVNQYRVNYAQELLAQQYGTMAEVAFESGFQNIRSFNNTYKKFFHSVPSEFNK
ncbi:MAG: AraC family transcriptional regulator [Herbinix sp.]|jgi:YesN/AraC family two-component response regulator|nr:AraC family transcriptional regulator [Herbinix sp.]